MPLAAGGRLGPYEILAPIGAGGIGEVYGAVPHVRGLRWNPLPQGSRSSRRAEPSLHQLVLGRSSSTRPDKSRCAPHPVLSAARDAPNRKKAVNTARE